MSTYLSTSVLKVRYANSIPSPDTDGDGRKAGQRCTTHVSSRDYSNPPSCSVFSWHDTVQKYRSSSNRKTARFSETFSHINTIKLRQISASNDLLWVLLTAYLKTNLLVQIATWMQNVKHNKCVIWHQHPCVLQIGFFMFPTKGSNYFPKRGSGSSVGIASELRVGPSGIEFRCGRDFPPVQTCPGSHPASCTMGTGYFPEVKCGRGVLLTTHPLLVPRSWKSRAIPLPTLWATSGL